MQTDRELLEAAAKAWGRFIPAHTWTAQEALNNPEEYWNPLDNGDEALKLATHLHMMINIEHGETEVAAHPSVSEGNSVVEMHNGDPAAATRRAIVRCAALGAPK